MTLEPYRTRVTPRPRRHPSAFLGTRLDRIAQPRENEVDRGAAGIDGSIEIAPTALDTNLGLIDTLGTWGLT